MCPTGLQNIVDVELQQICIRINTDSKNITTDDICTVDLEAFLLIFTIAHTNSPNCRINVT